jgi:hypothetical protein
MTIRRIRPDEAAAVAQLWFDMCAQDPDPANHLQERSHAPIERALTAAAVHRDATCLVAERDGELVGFVTAAVLAHPVLLGTAGEVEELYGPGVERELAEAAVAWLQMCDGIGAIVHHTDIAGADPLWTELGFERDVARYSLYR